MVLSEQITGFIVSSRYLDVTRLSDRDNSIIWSKTEILSDEVALRMRQELIISTSYRLCDHSVA